MGSSSSKDMSSYIQDTIGSNKVVVFSKTYCPFCTKAKRSLANVGCTNFKSVELDQMADGSSIQSGLLSLTGQRTVPNVFIGGKSIGGGDDTAALEQSGKLKTMLQAAGAL
uniref:Glutaredoxin domain-containing protein n=2 Tax=Corethron hystrix TaxID=216773 RepID=A0A7S1B3V4_9STRA|mmetsp:Transcript_11421/g.25069  ORF Transcript_11421/g.25069 Transcript_11421/m.25069 type:complete len:111 (+) Transcript_11421:80-412(+)